MLTTGIFTTHKYNIDAEIGKPFKFIPFGDIHRDSDMFSDTKWKEFLRYAKAQKNAYFLGLGDYTDGMSTSERKAISSSGMHDTTIRSMERYYEGWTDRLYKELSFMEGRCMGLIGGNHFFDIGNGYTTDTLLAERLGTKFLGVCSFLRMSITITSSTGKSMGTKKNIDIFAHHGKGGGTLAGSTFNTVEKMANVAEADIYLMGHDHKKGVVPGAPRLTAHSARGGGIRMRERQPFYGRTGSFLKAYEDGKVSYNVDACRTPASLGWIEFEITPIRDCHDGKDEINFSIRATS